MNKKIFIVIMSLLVSLTGCGSSKTTSSSPKEKINIKDIAWNVDEGIVVYFLTIRIIQIIQSPILNLHSKKKRI